MGRVDIDAVRGVVSVPLVVFSDGRRRSGVVVVRGKLRIGCVVSLVANRSCGGIAIEPGTVRGSISCVLGHFR